MLEQERNAFGQVEPGLRWLGTTTSCEAGRFFEHLPLQPRHARESCPGATTGHIAIAPTDSDLQRLDLTHQKFATK